jgi:hypothetical protein
MSTHREVIAELDARHEELIQKLDALNADIERVLAEFAKSRTATPQEVPATAPATEAPARRAA